MDKKLEFSATKSDLTRPGVDGSARVHWKKSKLKSKSWCKSTYAYYYFYTMIVNKLRTNFSCFVVEIAETKR
ncbi:hypothetical protein Hanom_Chr03g00243871 [Helianthus anomalus]